ncbi:HPr family phosphocarrier protein [Cellulomonas sp. P24]|uniref:HPr family phosphocarrier protein n=1 Tax=Cellulomonas sp. P24 TaxID=2885206 RepID=UPI00216AE75A|nr:HPr family phosphocarrier protein [Cellulomonas sp. P24]MCR6492220.1 HPr family phosphocarrier protein [Cellulomonas sp. P24]
MPQRTVAVASRVGLHARPASLFTQAVAASGHTVTIANGDGPAVDASSILMVMTLGAGHGALVTVTVDGPEADRVLGELVELLETDLDAPEAS